MIDVFCIIKDITEQLTPHSPTPQFDAELLLANVLKIPSNRLYTAVYTQLANKPLTKAQQSTLEKYTQRRKKGEPMAYILETQGFWSLDLNVNPHTLIPRPATELLVEQVLTCFSTESTHHILDLGTGSGTIALALAHERPHWKLTASDYYPEALNTAKANAQNYQIKNIAFVLSDWCKQLQGIRVDAIVSNPPYIKMDDSHLEQGDLRFEPKHALASGPDGLTALRTIINESHKLLKPGGYLLLEHGFDQGKDVRHLMKAAGYTDIKQYRDLDSHERVAVGRNSQKHHHALLMETA